MPIPNVQIAFANYESLDSLRPPLAHVIYLERRKGLTYGVVQFFGVIQLFLILGINLKAESNPAILGILDPLQGAESFTAVEALNLPAPRPASPSEFNALNQAWLRKFEESAVARRSGPGI